jgi:hypothetical protein
VYSSGLASDDFDKRPPFETKPGGINVYEVFFRLIVSPLIIRL